MTNCTHEWVHFEPKVTCWYDGWSSRATLTYEKWCKVCYLVKERKENYREITTIIEED
jgi:hypothetical protein